MVSENLELGVLYSIYNSDTKFRLIFRITKESGTHYHIDIKNCSIPVKYKTLHKKCDYFTNEKYVVATLPLTSDNEIDYIGILSENFLEQSLLKFRIEQLKQSIDVALSNYDKELFILLTNELNELK